jgi:hypothetical protein
MAFNITVNGTMHNGRVWDLGDRSGGGERHLRGNRQAAAQDASRCPYAETACMTQAE